MASVEILEAATRLGCRRVVSSGSLLEEPVGTAQAVPPSPYGASRWAASAYARMFHALFGTPVVILRPSFAYGPGQETTKLVPHVITKLLAGESPELSSGERMIDFVFAPDVAEAYVAAAVSPRRRGHDHRHRGRAPHLGARRRRDDRPARGPVDGRARLRAGPVRPLEQQIEVDPEVAAVRLAGALTRPSRRGYGGRSLGIAETVAQAAPDATTR